MGECGAVGACRSGVVVGENRPRTGLVQTWPIPDDERLALNARPGQQGIGALNLEPEVFDGVNTLLAYKKDQQSQCGECNARFHGRTDSMVLVQRQN